MSAGASCLLVEPDTGDIPVAGGPELHAQGHRGDIPSVRRARRRPVLPDTARARRPAVVKLHENGPLIGVPELFCAPDTVAVYAVPTASGLFGVNVATVLPPLKPTVPSTLFPVESTTVNDAVPASPPARTSPTAPPKPTPRRPRARRDSRHRRRTAGVTAFDGDDAGPAHRVGRRHREGITGPVGHPVTVVVVAGGFPDTSPASAPPTPYTASPCN